MGVQPTRYPDIDVDGKKIKLIGATKTYETKTDKDGIFEIYDLPPGKYFVEPEMSADWKIDPYLGRTRRAFLKPNICSQNENR